MRLDGTARPSLVTAGLNLACFIALVAASSKPWPARSMTLIWTTLPRLVDAQLEPDDALDPQALRLGRIDVLASGRGDQLRVLRDVDLGDRHEPAASRRPTAASGFSTRGPGLVISVWPTGTATEESPAVVALSDTPKLGGGSSVFAAAPRWGAAASGGGAVVGHAMDDARFRLGGRRLRLGGRGRLDLGRRQLLLDVDLDRLLGAKAAGIDAREPEREQAVQPDRDDGAHAGGPRAAGTRGPQVRKSFSGCRHVRYLPASLSVLMAKRWTPERLTMSMTWMTSP